MEQNNTREISKLDVVKEQLSDAIYLHLNGGSDIAVHTLAMAAYQVLYDILPEDSEWRRYGIFNKNHPLLEGLDAKQVIFQLREAMNFFKHADNDGEKSIVFSKDVNDVVIEGTINTFKEHNYTEYSKRLDLVLFSMHIINQKPDEYYSHLNDEKIKSNLKYLANKLNIDSKDNIKKTFNIARSYYNEKN
tara:strand:+ start:158 stop:727 length:570 start_codon:yes stop_codon:yes gene_type:complete